MIGKRIMALDVGDVRIGIALSDPFRIIASPLETYTCKSQDEDFAYIVNLAKLQDCDTIVLGLPLKMDGSDSEQTEKVRVYKDKLDLLLPAGIKTVFIDERLSSAQAEKILLQGDLSRKKRKQNIDKIAASIILETYLRMI